MSPSSHVNLKPRTPHHHTYPKIDFLHYWRLFDVNPTTSQKLSSSSSSFSSNTYTSPMMLDPKLQAVLAASASFFLVSIIFIVIFLLCKTNKKPYEFTEPRTRNRSRTAPTSTLTSITISESASFDPSLNRISMQDLIIATKNFSTDRIVGDGSFGYVYKARLSNGVAVAVKKLSKDAFQGFREFRAEMETLGQNNIRHPNLVRILGYCVYGDDRVLIYEFIEKGSLDQWLHDTSTESVSSGSRHPLKWDTRVKIMKGVANGLTFLHSLDTPIIHRDIKASNVLLDSDFESHIADFGLARRIELWHSHVSTQVAGTMGYMPPEYKSGATAATRKADVYSFGILMIEVATGRRPNWPIKWEDGKEVGLGEWAAQMLAQGRQVEMVDANVSRESLSESEIGEYMRIACMCIREIAKERPYIKDVVPLLDNLTS